MPPVAGGLPDDERAIGRELDDREANSVKVGNVLEPRVGEIAARDLGPALDQVARDRGAAERVPVRLAPVEVGHRRPHRQGGVGHASR